MEPNKCLLIADRADWIPSGTNTPSLTRDDMPDPRERRAAMIAGAKSGAETVILVEEGLWIAESHQPDVLLVTDLIAFLNPEIIDVRTPEGKIRFVDVTNPFSIEAVDEAERRCKEAGLSVERGCAAGIPSLELTTPAERRAVCSLGAAAITNSIPQEVKHSRAAGLKTLAVVLLNNSVARRVVALLACR